MPEVFSLDLINLLLFTMPGFFFLRAFGYDSKSDFAYFMYSMFWGFLLVVLFYGIWPIDKLLPLLPLLENPYVGALTFSTIFYVFGMFLRYVKHDISDQQPFTYNRRWHTQLAGNLFVINILFGSTIGIYLANTLSFRLNDWYDQAIVFVALSVVGTTLIFNNLRENSRLYNYRKAINAEIDKKLHGLSSWYASIGDYMIPAMMPIVVSYFMTLEYFSSNKYLIVITGIISFCILLFSAFQHSLRELEKTAAPVDIYFIDKEQEVIREAKILKVTDDNIRIRVADSILIINKSEVLKIEMKIPEKML